MRGRVGALSGNGPHVGWFGVGLLALLAFPLTAGAQTTARCELTWTLEERLRIGSIDGAVTLTAPVHVTLDRDRRIYLTERSVSQITVFRPDGSIERTIGRPGAGPGEFQGPLGMMGWRGDTLWVGVGRGFQYFREGREVGRLTGPVPTPEWRSGLYGFWPQQPFPDGSFGAVSRYHPETVVNGTLSHHTLFRVSEQWSVEDTLLSIDISGIGRTLDFGDAPAGTLFHVLAPPFPEFLRSRDGAAAVVLDAPGTGTASFRFWAVDGRGGTLFDRTLPYDPVPLTRERTEAMMEELIEVYSVDSFAALTGRSATRPRGVVERAVRTAFPMPETLPPVREIRSGDDDTVWLLREDLGGAADTWEVFDLEGRLVGRLTTPRVRSIFHRDGWRPLRLTRDEVWGTEQGEYDEPYVVQYAVRRGCA